MTTSLPEPVTDVWASWRGEREFLSAWDDYYTADQMRAYGAAEYKRAIEAALQICIQTANSCEASRDGLEPLEKLVLRGAQRQPEKLAAAIIQLGEKS